MVDMEDDAADLDTVDASASAGSDAGSAGEPTGDDRRGSATNVKGQRLDSDAMEEMLLQQMQAMQMMQTRLFGELCAELTAPAPVEAAAPQPTFVRVGARFSAESSSSRAFAPAPRIRSDAAADVMSAALGAARPGALSSPRPGDFLAAHERRLRSVDTRLDALLAEVKMPPPSFEEREQDLHERQRQLREENGEIRHREVRVRLDAGRDRKVEALAREKKHRARKELVRALEHAMQVRAETVTRAELTQRRRELHRDARRRADEMDAKERWLLHMEVEQRRVAKYLPRSEKLEADYYREPWRELQFERERDQLQRRPTQHFQLGTPPGTPRRSPSPRQRNLEASPGSPFSSALSPRASASPRRRGDPSPAPSRPQRNWHLDFDDTADEVARDWFSPAESREIVGRPYVPPLWEDEAPSVADGPHTGASDGRSAVAWVVEIDAGPTALPPHLRRARSSAATSASVRSGASRSRPSVGASSSRGRGSVTSASAVSAVSEATSSAA
eukprot:TRINITY_DN25640_c0_g2_i1.p1 TRINITY_DN25640_c0_g2~~TRINITY_DN25640_c0_g2_i1.p1  ORF type:complete len:504 (+),score=125.57 TRINITY_DN25640_c0_g2_i1:205-1716(+)